MIPRNQPYRNPCLRYSYGIPVPSRLHTIGVHDPTHLNTSIVLDAYGCRLPHVGCCSGKVLPWGGENESKPLLACDMKEKEAVSVAGISHVYRCQDP